MRRTSIILILELILVRGLFAIKVNIEDVNLMENNISFLLNITDMNNETYYFTNLHNPFYKINGDVLHVYFSQFEIPEEVCMDFPEIKGDETVDSNISIKKRIFLDENNYVPFEEKPKTAEIKKIKKIVFVFGYLKEYDKKILEVGLGDSIKQREKFYYVVKRQRLLYWEVVLGGSMYKSSKKVGEPEEWNENYNSNIQYSLRKYQKDSYMQLQKMKLFMYRGMAR